MFSAQSVCASELWHGLKDLGKSSCFNNMSMFISLRLRMTAGEAMMVIMYVYVQL